MIFLQANDIFAIFYNFHVSEIVHYLIKSYRLKTQSNTNLVDFYFIT